MERGLLAALSPNEEITLRRIAHGMAGPKDLNKHDVQHLTTLGLAYERGDASALTDLGKRRFSQLPNRVLGRGPFKDNEHFVELAMALGVKR
jgi:hypothetical protein